VDSLTNAENLGALVRNCAAFGVHALITGETSTSPFLRRAVRSSMGTIFQLPIVELGSVHVSRFMFHSNEPATDNLQPASLAATLRHMRSKGIHCVAAHPHATAKTLPQADFAGDCCILFGSEGYGISESLLDLCDQAAAIPMAQNIDSLNVAAAAAVFLYEAFRQRNT
jgi:tRNA G18 (ribose-2'-O)-methylase SpoU